jgi:hypothetical protein
MQRHAPTRRHLSITFAIAGGAVLAACGSAPAATSSNGGAGSTTAPTSGAAATSSGTSALPSCPTGAAVSAAAGTSYPDPTVQSSAGFLTCTYEDSSTGANLVIVGTSEAGVTAATVQAVVQSQAAAQHVTASSVSGLGSAAFTFTLNDAANNVLHVDTTVVEFIQGSNILDITAEATLAQVEAVGHLLLGQ